MAKKGLPKQGAEALLNAWSDANEMILKQKKDGKEKERDANREFRKYVKGKE